LRQITDDPITEAECWALLASASVGRLALSMEALPTIVPVQYYLDGNKIALCLGHYQVPGQAVANTVAAFAADAIDTSTSQGWAVQVLGRVATPQPMNGPSECGQHAGGQVIHLTPATIAGQRLHLCPFLFGGSPVTRGGE
jgi:hypothetical protein